MTARMQAVFQAADGARLTGSAGCLCALDLLAAGAGRASSSKRRRMERATAGVGTAQSTGGPVVETLPVLWKSAPDHLTFRSAGGQGAPHGFAGPVNLAHPASCPLRVCSHQDPVPPEVTALSGSRRIAVVVALLTKGTNRLLLTKRTPHMRTFPNVWVVPGGGVDPGENLIPAAAREVLEETSIVVPEEDISIVGFFESCYPVLVSNGLPIRTHMIALTVARISEEAVGLEALRLQPEEVAAAAWLGPEHVRSLLLASGLLADGEDTAGVPDARTARVAALVPGAAERLTTVPLEPLAFGHNGLSAAKDCERMGTNTWHLLKELHSLGMLSSL